MGDKTKKGKRPRREPAPLGSVGERVRRLRAAAVPKITQGDLAKAAGISVQSISGLERGDSRGLKPENLFPIAERLGVNPYYLATGKGSADPIKQLSPEESELILIFRDLDKDDRAQVLGFAKGVQRKTTPLALVPPRKSA